MPEDYAQEIWKKYSRLKTEDKLFPYLVTPKRKAIRDRCNKLIGTEIDGAGQRLEYFLDSRNRRQLDIDKFRPVVSYLTGKTSNPDINVVQLVEWLIELDQKGEDDNEDEVISPGGGLKKKWYTLIISISIFLIGLVSFCPRYMTWKSDHYEWLILDDKKQLVMPVNWDLVWNFKKVDKDTLTKYSVGKLWYLKENNDHEVFTMAGKHPLLPNRNLHILSDRILDSIQKNVRERKAIQSLMIKQP